MSLPLTTRASFGISVLGIGCGQLLGASFDDLPRRDDRASESDSGPFEGGDSDTFDVGNPLHPDVADGGDAPDFGNADIGEADTGPSDGAGSICLPPPVCTGDISNIGTGEFSISFRIATVSSAKSGILSQRVLCTSREFWDIRLFNAGHLLIELEANGGADYDALLSTLTINDGVFHEVRVCRRLAKLYIFIDEKAAGSIPSQASLGPLAPLATGTSVCMDIDGTSTLVGAILDVCVGSL